MFIVLGLNSDEFGRGNSRLVHKFDDEEALTKFVTSYNGDASRLEIYRGIRVDVRVSVVEFDPYSI